MTDDRFRCSVSLLRLARLHGGLGTSCQVITNARRTAAAEGDYTDSRRVDLEQHGSCLLAALTFGVQVWIV